MPGFERYKPRGMSYRAWDRQRSCTRKVYFKRRGKARKKGHPRGLFVYKCRHCDGYHLTSSRRRRPG